VVGGHHRRLVRPYRREVNADSLWIFRTTPADAPAPELQRRVITQQLGDIRGDHKDRLAVHAAELIEPLVGTWDCRSWVGWPVLGWDRRL